MFIYIHTYPTTKAISKNAFSHFSMTITLCMVKASSSSNPFVNVHLLGPPAIRLSSSTDGFLFVWRDSSLGGIPRLHQ